MSGGRDQILSGLRRSLKRGDDGGAGQAAVEARMTAGKRGTVPQRAALPKPEQVRLFEEMLKELSATLQRVDSADEVPGAVADYLKGLNLPPSLRLAPSPELDDLPWSDQPLLEIKKGAAAAEDEVSVTGAFAAVAETGTLMLRSDSESPTSLGFLPENHVVVLKASQTVGSYEDAWDRLRDEQGQGRMPRSVNFITGPSRTGDIEQKIELGAHGPRRLHFILIDDLEDAAPA